MQRFLLTAVLLAATAVSVSTANAAPPSEPSGKGDWSWTWVYVVQMAEAPQSTIFALEYRVNGRWVLHGEYASSQDASKMALKIGGYYETKVTERLPTPEWETVATLDDHDDAIDLAHDIESTGQFLARIVLVMVPKDLSIARDQGMEIPGKPIAFDDIEGIPLLFELPQPQPGAGPLTR